MRPFLLSCASKTPKLAGTSISSLQRLVVSNALAKETLKDVLDVLRDCTALAQDIQLKILQVLPPLVQNYAAYLVDELLATALHICFLLFASKPAVIANTAAATLQQLVVSVFGRAAQEDEIADDEAFVTEIPVEDVSVAVRSAALDAYRLLNDICLLTEGHDPTFLFPASMPQNFGLEILESILSNYAVTISAHPELVHVLRIRLMPFIIRVLSERVMFSITVRSMRLLPVIFSDLLSVLPSECEMMLSLLNHILDPEAATLWKRVLCMEIFRGLHSDASLVRSIYHRFDEPEGKRNIIQDHMSTMVRLASEKPSIIGLGQHSSVPASSGQTEDDVDEMAALQADGVAGTFGVAMTLRASTAPGISMRLSTMRVQCLDQLDKTEPPPIPPAYLYTLALTCLNSFSEGLTRFLQPFTIVHDGSSRKKQVSTVDDAKSVAPTMDDAEVDEDRKPQTPSSPNEARLPVNPLDHRDHALFDQIQTSAHMTEACWPAMLASYSTYFHAALDAEYFHALVRSFQKFTQIAGVLRLSTPRDAFLTALGKNAVPSGLAPMSSSGFESPAAETRETRRDTRTGNEKGPLSGALGSASEKGRRSIEMNRASLNTRNLLCLRALLHLGIALGPVLGHAWSIILETLQAADLIIHHITTRRRQARGVANSAANDGEGLGDIGSEINAARVAAARMFESSADLPNPGFLDVTRSTCALLRHGREKPTTSERHVPSPTGSRTHTPSSSMSRILAGAGPSSDPRATLFVIETLGKIVEVNSERLLQRPPAESGWTVINDALQGVISVPFAPLQLRTAASHLACHLVDLTSSPNLGGSRADAIREEGLQALVSLVASLHKLPSEDKASRSCELDIHDRALETLKLALERYGDSLIIGWDAVFTIISSVFESSQDADTRSTSSPPAAHSAKLVRSSFASLHLICSDFLASVPRSYVASMLHANSLFCCQQDEFNISLTATTLLGNVSDFILQTPSTGGSHDQTVVSETSVEAEGSSLMDLVSALVNVTVDQRPEIRHNAIHVLFSILDSWSDRLTTQEWAAFQHRIVLALFTSNAAKYGQLSSSQVPDAEEQMISWNEAMVLILDRVSRLLTAGLDRVLHETSFPSFWSMLLARLHALLERRDLKLSGAVFGALDRILSTAASEHGHNFKDSAEAVWELWRDGNPAPQSRPRPSGPDNQATLLAYIRCLTTLETIIGPNLRLDQLRSMLAELRECIVRSSSGAYSEGLDRMTLVQSEIMKFIRHVDAKRNAFAPEVVQSLSSIGSLAYERNQDMSAKSGPTFVALSKAALSELEALMGRCDALEDVFQSGSFVAALGALSNSILQKYATTPEGKDIALWRKATQVLIGVTRSSVPVLIDMRLEDAGEVQIWTELIACVQAIIGPGPEDASQPRDSADDQEFDIEAFENMYGLLVPALGHEMVRDSLRRRFVASVFEGSLIHEPHPDDLPSDSGDVLENIKSEHIGRVRRLLPSGRSRVSRALLNKLFDLVTRRDGSEPWIRLAQAAAPYLILRVSLILKAYVLDQPLRGRMPLPASQKKELLHVLTKLIELESEPKAIPQAPGIVSDQRRHLYWVYGLVVRAQVVARTDTVLHGALSKVTRTISMDFRV